MPKVSLGKPSFFEISVHVSPLSVLFHNAEPSPPLLKEYGVRFARQVEAYKIRGLLGSKVRSTAPAWLFTNSFFFHVFPPSVLL